MSATQSRGLDKESETLSYRLVAERFAFEITVLNLHPALKSVIPCHHKRIAECFRLDAKLPQTGAQILYNLHIVVALRNGQFHFISIRRDQQRKRDVYKRQDLFLKGLDDLKIAHTDPQGAYYVLLDIAEFGYESDLAFCEDLAHYVGVGAVPGSSFFREPVNNLIRLHFAKKDETLLDALNRLEGLQMCIRDRTGYIQYITGKVR